MSSAGWDVHAERRSQMNIIEREQACDLAAPRTKENLANPPNVNS